jgi:thioredoxin reductase
MPAGMYLKSTASASSLSAPAPGHTLADFCRSAGLTPPADKHPLPINLFVRYGLWFQERQAPAVERERVRRVAPVESGFALTLESGEELQADTVVVASGIASLAHVPAELRAVVPAGPSPDGPLSHSSQHCDFSRFAGKEVAVVGAGQSALESAALLHEAGAAVRVLVRGATVLYGRPPQEESGGRLGSVIKPGSPLGPGWSHFVVSRAPRLIRYLPAQGRFHLVRSVLGPSGAWWLRERVAGRLQVSTGQRVRAGALTGERVSLTLEDRGGRTERLTVDHVLAATGYRVDLRSFDFLAEDLYPRLKQVKGWPRLTASFESSVPGLFFTGLPAAGTFGPLLRFVCGTAFAARRTSAGVAGRIRSS